MLQVGVDAHKEMSQVTVMDQSGHVLKRRGISSTGEGVRSALAGNGEPIPRPCSFGSTASDTIVPHLKPKISARISQLPLGSTSDRVYDSGSGDVLSAL